MAANTLREQRCPVAQQVEMSQGVCGLLWASWVSRLVKSRIQDRSGGGSWIVAKFQPKTLADLPEVGPKLLNAAREEAASYPERVIESHREAVPPTPPIAKRQP